MTELIIEDLEGIAESRFMKKAGSYAVAPSGLNMVGALGDDLELATLEPSAS